MKQSYHTNASTNVHIRTQIQNNTLFWAKGVGK